MSQQFCSPDEAQQRGLLSSWSLATHCTPKHIEKVLKSVIAQQILSLSEEHSHLSAQHMGACPSRSIDTALDFMKQQICATR